MKHLYELPAVEQRALLEKGDITAEGLTRQYLRRIAAYDQPCGLNSVAFFDQMMVVSIQFYLLEYISLHLQLNKTFKEKGYLLDTHTAVALNVCEQYKEKTGDEKICVIASTASPYKFALDVLASVSEEKGDTEFSNVELLSKVTSTEIPAPISALKSAKARFKEEIEKEEMLGSVYSSLGI